MLLLLLREIDCRSKRRFTQSVVERITLTRSTYCYKWRRESNSLRVSSLPSKAGASFSMESFALPSIARSRTVSCSTTCCFSLSRSPRCVSCSCTRVQASLTELTGAAAQPKGFYQYKMVQVYPLVYLLLGDDVHDQGAFDIRINQRAPPRTLVNLAVSTSQNRLLQVERRSASRWWIHKAGWCSSSILSLRVPSGSTPCTR